VSTLQWILQEKKNNNVKPVGYTKKYGHLYCWLEIGNKLYRVEV